MKASIQEAMQQMKDGFDATEAFSIHSKAPAQTKEDPASMFDEKIKPFFESKELGDYQKFGYATKVREQERNRGSSTVTCTQE